VVRSKESKMARSKNDKDLIEDYDGPTRQEEEGRRRDASKQTTRYRLRLALDDDETTTTEHLQHEDNKTATEKNNKMKTHHIKHTQHAGTTLSSYIV